jgi:hypothetical protein
MIGTASLEDKILSIFNLLRLVMGIQRKNNGFLINDEDEKYRVAVHEIGHTFMILYNPESKGLQAPVDTSKIK